MDDEITIKIQTLDNIYPLTLKRLSTVIELQEKISENFNIPINNQRLIFQGKYLQSSTEKLKSYKIQNESVIHLLIKQTNNEENNNNNINININNNIPEENQNSFNIIHNNIPFISLNRRNNPRHSRRHNMHFDPSDCIESLYQNILTINNLIQCKNTFDYSHILNSKTIKPFNFKKRKFEIGEWIDVRDTIDNWLEAQIVNIRNNVNGTKEVLVHYNGWGNRWNEWININSKRISHFKNYTLQNQNSILLSPNPTVNTDGYLNFNENNTQPNRPIDVFFYFDKINGIMNEINKMLEKMKLLKKKQTNNINPNNIEEDNNNNNNNNFNNNSNNNNNDHSLNLNNLIPFTMNETEILLMISQIIPILDRGGRLMADLSLLLSHCVLNPNLYPKLLFGHNLNEVSDSISCTSGYSMITNESSSIYSGLTNNLRFLQEQNVITNLQSNRNQNNNINNNINNINNNSNNNNNNINVISSNIINNTNNNLNNNINRSNTNNTVYSIPHYFLNNNNYELPFIQRLNYNNNLHTNAFNNNNNIINNNNNNQNNNNNTNNNTLTNIYDSFPKIILQVPPLLSPNEFNLVNNYNPIDEQNIFLIGHNVFVDNSNNITNTQNITRINNNNFNFNNNNIINNNNNINTNNINNNINININNNINNNTTINNNNIINNNIINNNINNINITEITENNNTINLEEDTNNFRIISSNSLNNTFFKTNYSQKRRNTSVASSHSNKSADQILYTKKFNYHLIKELKENEKDDYNINLLKNLNKENYDNYYIENISLKSDKNTSIKNKNLSYKSVSEVDEFGEYDEEDKKKENNMLNSVNRSIESFENEVNISYGNISNTNSISTQKEFLKENNTIQELTEDNENINENNENSNNNIINKSNKKEKK